MILRLLPLNINDIQWNIWAPQNHILWVKFVAEIDQAILKIQH